MSLSDPRPQGRVRDPDALKRFRLENLGEPCDFDCGRLGTDAHHKTFRSQGGNDEPGNLLWLCRYCHDGIHNGRLDRHNLG